MVSPETRVYRLSAERIRERYPDDADLYPYGAIIYIEGLKIRIEAIPPPGEPPPQTDSRITEYR